MHSYSYSQGSYDLDSVNSLATGIEVWMIISLVVAIIGGIVVYYVFFKPDKHMPNKFLTWLKDFFNFRKMLVEDVLKVIYIILATYITLVSFSFIFVDVVSFLSTLILGNIVLRLMFEFILITIMIWKNTTDINNKLKNNKED